MMIEVTKEFIFHAAHRDENADDKCSRLHGHTYKLEVAVLGHHRGDMLLHGDVLKKVYWEHLEPYLEHQYLNETLPVNPTMERTADWCASQFCSGLRNEIVNPNWLTRVCCTLWETPTMHCTVTKRL